MIKYQLICDRNHEFEGWFQTSFAFTEQASKGFLRCPLCDSGQVKRALMTPNLASPKRRSLMDEPSVDQKPISSQNSRTATKTEKIQGFGAVLAELRYLQKKISKECRDVGDNFAEEARKIHYGESEAEGIYGQTTHEEREALEDEGIEVLDMPWLPPDQ